MTKKVLCLTILIAIFTIACNQAANPEARMSFANASELTNAAEPCATPKGGKAADEPLLAEFQKLKNAWETKNESALNEVMASNSLHTVGASQTTIPGRSAMIPKIKEAWMTYSVIEFEQ